MPDKPKIIFDIKIDVYDNGQGIIIKRVKDRKIIGRKVFLTNQQKQADAWIKKMTESGQNG